MPDLATVLAHVARAATRKVDPDRLDQIDHTLLAEVAPLVDAACRAWFDLEVRGTEHLPAGSALVVGNHSSGITFVEALGWGARLYLDGHMGDGWLALAHDAMVDLPLVGPFLVSTCAVRASHANADAAFAAGRKVLVFPGGNPEAFRPWSARSRIDLQGRRGFVRLALRHQIPIVPVVFHGGHDGLLVLADNRWLARASGAQKLLRTEVWPLFVGLPWGFMLGPMFHLPLPVKVVACILEPIPVAPHPPEAEDDPEVVDALYERVTAAMQAGLDALVREVPRPLHGAASRVRRTWAMLRGR